MTDELCTVVFEGRPTSFRVVNPEDHIQSFHLRGVFYESDQLLRHRELIPMKSTVLDIGANVGNHSLFYAMHTAAAFVYPFEPNLFARKILVENIAANTDYRAEIRAQYTHLAVGRTPASLSIAENPHNNLGGTRFTCAGPEDQNSVQCAPLDNLTFEGVISFLKIDVEGMELDVLSGAENMIEKHRPVIVIEISEYNDTIFGSG